jgi:hypothetical protein
MESPHMKKFIQGMSAETIQEESLILLSIPNNQLLNIVKALISFKNL